MQSIDFEDSEAVSNLFHPNSYIRLPGLLVAVFNTVFDQFQTPGVSPVLFNSTNLVHSHSPGGKLECWRTLRPLANRSSAENP